LAQLAVVAWSLGENDRALQIGERAERILGGVKTPPGMAFLHGAHAYVSVARLRLDQGEPARAEELIAPVLAAAESAGWQEAIANGSLVRGRCRVAQDDGEGARAQFGRALEVAELSGLPRATWEAHQALAGLERAEGMASSADEHTAKAEQAIATVAASIEDRRLRAGFLKGASLTAERR